MDEAAISVEVKQPAALSPGERRLWDGFRAAQPGYASPYFDLRYVLAASRAAPSCAVAVIKRAGQVIGFLPFQRRGGAIQPLGAPMTDYHGPLLAAGEVVSLEAMVAALQARTYRFSGLVTDAAAQDPRLTRRRTMQADLSAGFDAWLQRQEAHHPRFFKGKRRNLRALEREVGPLEFCWSRVDDGVLDYVIGLKRAQYRRTRRHDIFACGWTEQMLRGLLADNAPDFGLGFATLRAGGRLLAAEVALLSGGVYHLWLPVYDPAYARYGPGMLMTLETLKAVAAAGIHTVDFGHEDAAYKRYLASPSQCVAEGVVAARPTVVSQLAEAAPLLTQIQARVRRRLDVISACETSALGWTCAVVLAAGLLVAPGISSPHRHGHSPRRPESSRIQPRSLDAGPEALKPPRI